MANERNILNPLKILKASFSFPQIIPQITQTHTLYTSLYHFISFLPYFIILDNNNSVKLSNKMSSLETVDLGEGQRFFLQKYARWAQRDQQKFIFSV